MKSSLPLVFLLLFSSISLGGTIRIVNNENPTPSEYPDIQTAINASLDGDLILVQPTSTAYTTFHLDRAVLIQSASENQRFQVNGRSRAWGNSYREIKISGVQNSQFAAGISRMDFTQQEVWITIANCSAEIILDQVKIEGTSNLGLFEGCSLDNSRLQITNCPKVFLHQVEGISRKPTTECDYFPNPIVSIQNSSASISQSSWTSEEAPYPPGAVYFGFDGFPGGKGIYLSSSYLVLADSQVTGGPGGNATCDPTFCGIGGNGGYGIRAINNSEVLFLGPESTAKVIQAGQGGAGDDQDGNCGLGGKGGDSLILDSSSKFTADRSDFMAAGLGGLHQGAPGCGRNISGKSVRGNGIFQEDPALPYLSLTGNLAVGGSVTLELDGQMPGTMLLMISGAGGFATFNYFSGPKLSVFSGITPVTLWAWPTDGNGDIYLPGGSIPNDPNLAGFPMHLQAAMFYTGRNYLSNAQAFLIGP